jgi:hypothetical protein
LEQTQYDTNTNAQSNKTTNPLLIFGVYVRDIAADAQNNMSTFSGLPRAILALPLPNTHASTKNPAVI